MRKLTLPFILAVVALAAFFNVGMAQASTVGQEVCNLDLCGDATPLDYQDYEGIYGMCHKNNLANPNFYNPDYNGPSIGRELNRPGDTWWVYDEGAGTAGNGTCPDNTSYVVAKTQFYLNVSVTNDEWDDRYFPACSVNKNPCEQGRTAFYVELTQVPVSGEPLSAGADMNTRIDTW